MISGILVALIFPMVVMPLIGVNKELWILVMGISIVVLAATIFLNSYGYTHTANLEDKYPLYYVLISSSLIAVLLIYLNIKILGEDQVSSELASTKKMLHSQKYFYDREKQVVETLNIKSHDLKHRLSSMRPNLGNDEYEELNKIVSDYDSFVKTGNDAVDVILTEKEILSKNKNIRFTALVDGSLFSFVKDSDIYSLLGNLLDNAIEAVSKIETEDKRVVSLTARKECGFLSIHEENFYVGDIVLKNGRPLTSKENKLYHGFGIRSIDLIAEKYHGTVDIKIESGTFSIDVMLPLDEKR